MLKRMTYNWLPVTASAAVITFSACNNASEPSEKEKVVQENPVIVSLKNQIKNYPDSAVLYTKLIDEYARTKAFDSAVGWTDKLINQDPQRNFLFWLDRGNLQRQAGWYDSAIYSYNHYLQVYPDDEGVLLNLANTLAEAGRPESIQLTSRIVQQFPTVENRTDAFFINGVYYSRTKKLDSAVANYEKAIVYRNTFWEAHLEKGIAYFDANKIDKALATFQQLQQANPSYPDAYYWIGKCQEVLQNKTEALKNYEMAYSLDKNFTDARLKLDSLKNL